MTHQCPECGSLCNCWQADDPQASESDGECHHVCDLEESENEEEENE